MGAAGRVREPGQRRIRARGGPRRSASRELAEETGLEVFPGYLEQLKTYGSPWRDRRGRVFSTAYVGMMPDLPTPRRGGDAADTHFFAVGDLNSADGPDLPSTIWSFPGRSRRVRGKIDARAAWLPRF